MPLGGYRGAGQTVLKIVIVLVKMLCFRLDIARVCSGRCVVMMQGTV